MSKHMRSFKLYSLEILATMFAILSAIAYLNDLFSANVMAAILGFACYIESAEFLPEDYFEEQKSKQDDK